MRRLLRWSGHALSLLCLLLSVSVCLLWYRSRTGADIFAWRYDRYLPDRSAASTEIHFTSNQRRIWFGASWGHVAPFNGQLVWGYYVNADRSGGHPQFTLDHQPYDPMSQWLYKDSDPDAATSGRGPVRWLIASRWTPKDGDDYRAISVGVSYWLLTFLLLLPALLSLHRIRKARRRRNRNLCAKCGYDLRATPDRCPECGHTSGASR